MKFLFGSRPIFRCYASWCTSLEDSPPFENKKWQRKHAGKSESFFKTYDIPCLKLTVRPWKWAFPKGNSELLFQPSIFRCELSVSGSIPHHPASPVTASAPMLRSAASSPLKKRERRKQSTGSTGKRKGYKVQGKSCPQLSWLVNLTPPNYLGSGTSRIPNSW